MCKFAINAVALPVIQYRPFTIPLFQKQLELCNATDPSSLQDHRIIPARKGLTAEHRSNLSIPGGV